MKKETLIAYVPVLHRGYLEFFRQYPGATLYLFSREILEQYPHLVKNLPAIDPIDILFSLGTLIGHNRLPIKAVYLLTMQIVKNCIDQFGAIYMPDEDVSREFASHYLPNYDINWISLFLRRDKQNTFAISEVVPNITLTEDEFHRQIMDRAAKEAEKSSDFWRQVGAIVVKAGEIIVVGYNRHVPSPQTPYAYGDPRSNSTRGIEIELSTALHAEANVIAQAAKDGISLQGADLYVTTFPCPPCAKLVAYAGIKRLFFRDGYSKLDGQSILESNNVEIIQVI